MDIDILALDLINRLRAARVTLDVTNKGGQWIATLRTTDDNRIVYLGASADLAEAISMAIDMVVDPPTLTLAH